MGLAVRTAAEVSVKTGSEIELIYGGKGISALAAYNEPSSSDTEAALEACELLGEVAREIETDGGRVLETHIVPGEKPAEEIVKLTREEDIGLVVVGSRGPGRFQYAVQGSVFRIVARSYVSGPRRPWRVALHTKRRDTWRFWTTGRGGEARWIWATEWTRTASGRW